MKNKEFDIPYCGVDQQKIEKAQPILNWENVDHMKRFIMDRYRVHKRKDVKHLDPPWTNNPVLQVYKFTNVRREHDRQTRYLLDNITNDPDLSLEDKIVNSFLFRAWNNWSTMKDFGFPYTAEELYDPQLKDNVRPVYKSLDASDPKRLWYSNAFNQGATKVAWKYSDRDNEIIEEDIPLRPFHIAPYLKENSIVDQILCSNSQWEAYETIKTVDGYGEFLAYQVYVDLTYIPEFPFSENEFVIAGIGCKRGLNLIFEDKDHMTDSECIFWLRDHINGFPSLLNNPELGSVQRDKPIEYNPDKLFSDLPNYDRCMNVMSIENCMCELSKYVRTVNGTGRPRNKYKYKKSR